MQDQRIKAMVGQSRGGDGTLWRLFVTALFLLAAALSIWLTDTGARPVADLSAVIGLPEA